MSTTHTAATSSYSSLDFENSMKERNITVYPTIFDGSSGRPLDLPTTTFIYKPLRSFDEVMEEVLKERAEAWSKLEAPPEGECLAQ